MRVCMRHIFLDLLVYALIPLSALVLQSWLPRVLEP
jgi:hypothetical protein